MYEIAKGIMMAVLLVALCSAPGLGQATPTTILQIDVENQTQYVGDVSDLSKLATNPNATTPVSPVNFEQNVIIADIVGVNGQPAKGTFTRIARGVQLVTAPTPGQAIADTVRRAVIADTFEVLKSDGSPIGTIVSSGLAQGSPPLGAPLSITVGNFAIVGGTGAFLGARGQWGQAATAQTVPQHQASMAEDPANRRRNAGGQGKFRYVLQLIPFFRPEIVNTSGGPAITHPSNLFPVNLNRPALRGEILSALVTGLGPTRPGVDPGTPFPASPPSVVNSPVQVLVNGKPAEVLAAVGLPGSVEVYQVDFRIPLETPQGDATIQLTAAFIAGPEITIPVR